MRREPPNSPLYAETFFAVRFNPAVPCVEMTWRGYHTSAAFRAHNGEVMDAIRTHRADKLLADIRDFTLIGADDQKWLNEEWLPAAMATGLRCVALAVPVFYFNKVAVANVVDRIDTPMLQVAYVDTQTTDGHGWRGNILVPRRTKHHASTIAKQPPARLDVVDVSAARALGHFGW